MERKYNIGEMVTVQLCGGLVSGKVAEHTWHCFSKIPASRISGPNCCSIVKDVNIMPYNGQKDILKTTCGICDASDCCFRKKPFAGNI